MMIRATTTTIGKESLKRNKSKHIATPTRIKYYNAFHNTTTYQQRQESNSNTATATATATNKNATKTSLEATLQWKQQEQNKIVKKFTSTEQDKQQQQQQETITSIQNDEELQSMWKEMESRVTRRRLPPPLTHATTNKVGRRNVSKSDEDVWLQSGLYDEMNTTKN